MQTNPTSQQPGPTGPTVNRPPVPSTVPMWVIYGPVVIRVR